MHEKGYPKWADRFLKWYCRTELLEEIQGDLYEIFEHERQQHGLTKARRKFSWNVLRTFRLSTIKRLHPKFRLMPLRSHFKISYRQLIKQKYYSLINILGLAVGFCCCFFIGQFIIQEVSYDKSHPDQQNLFRLLTERSGNDGSEFGIYHNPPLAELAEVNLPEVHNSFRVRAGGSRLVKTAAGSESHHEELFLYVDQSMLSLLDFPLLYGDRQTALSTPNSIVLTEKKARKYFGSENPVGQEIFLSNQPEQPFQVTGVLSNKRPPSHIDYDFYLS
nr:ABC transporter permease [Saprospiraceae bacterium]